MSGYEPHGLTLAGANGQQVQESARGVHDLRSNARLLEPTLDFRQTLFDVFLEVVATLERRLPLLVLHPRLRNRTNDILDGVLIPVLSDDLVPRGVQVICATVPEIDVRADHTNACVRTVRCR